MADNIWTKLYSRINWKNKPSKQTPINETNLGKIDYAVDELDNRVLVLNTDVGNLQTETENLNNNLTQLELSDIAGGKNLFNKKNIILGYCIDNYGEYQSKPWGCCSYPIQIKPNTSYYLSHFVGTSSWYTSAILNENKEFISTLDIQGTADASGCITTPSNAKFIILNINNKFIDSCQIEEGTTATAYEPYIPSVKMLANETDSINDSLVAFSHNIPRTIPKDITTYYTDGTLWDRLNGTNGFALFEDIYVGDYIKMSRPISAYEQTQTYQTTGSQYVTIAGIDTLWGNGDSSAVIYHHLVMIPGQGFGGTQHFGRSRMNPTNTTVGGYVGSEMHTTTIGEVVTSGSTEATATINQQLYAEFGSHLKTTRELLTNNISASGYNRFGVNSGCSNNWTWASCQAVLMSEVEAYGSIVWSSSGYDTGVSKTQLPLFRNNTQALNNRTAYWWLKDVASSSNFCGCGSNGRADYYGASYASISVRPRFVIAA